MNAPKVVMQAKGLVKRYGALNVVSFASRKPQARLSHSKLL